jgi:hypothetical protein
MNATPERTTLTLPLQPLPEGTLPAAVAKLVTGPVSAKLMATRGMTTLRPVDLMVAIYQLAFDADTSIRAAASGAPAAFPDTVVLPPLREALAPAVLHFFAEHLPLTRSAAIEQILYNAATADETFVLLAQRLEDDRGLETIFANEVRLLRHPAIVEALYANKHARMSSVNRVLELYARNGLRLENIPGFDDIVGAIRQDPEALDPSTTDARFAEALASAENASAVEEAPPEPEKPEAGETVKPERQRATGMSFIKFEKLKIFEKIRLATVGNAYCRSVLIRDSNKLVSMAVVRSPQMTNLEITRIAGSTAVCDDVIRYIANSRQFNKDYPVKIALVKNPKCPLASSMHFLNYLHQDDLRELARSKNVPSALSLAAKKLAQQRDSRK